MSDLKSRDPQPDSATDAPVEAPADPSRRRLLGGMAAAGATLAVSGCARETPRAAAPRATGDIDRLLRERIRRVVVIYAENRSFNNLFADFPGLEKPLSSLTPAEYQQRDRDGSILATLPKVWHGLAPHAQVVEHRKYQVLEDDITDLPNAPWALRTGTGEPLPPGVVTRDLVHRFYENQRQINGGKNDGFVAWGNTGAMTMGYYGDNAATFRLWQLARQYTLCDNFFMGAFGGSFLNHQYLVAAEPPYYAHADHSPAKPNIAVTASGRADDIHIKLDKDSPASAMDGPPDYVGKTTLTPDFHVVNTMGPPYAPAFNKSPENPLYADPRAAYTLPPQDHRTIGDSLSDAGIDWAWYAGGWAAALAGQGEGEEGEFPESPNFQPHHQPFNYYARFAPGTAERSRHLRDGGLGDTPTSNRFLADIRAGKLPTVSFYKPQGNLNLHAGYADVDSGDRHIMRMVAALQESPHWQETLVIITVDENGGWWDQVAPPKGDRWGPGTRIPTLLVSPHVKKGFVDHTIYDTGSIQRFLNRRFGLTPLRGIVARDEAMRAAGGPAPGDLTAALDLAP
ncbi:MAG TPA: acid phosphatase [Rhodanobacteraceae bacterium]|nr:acid phosphatase [Rhodanobacteraceae bacterium]